MPDPRRQYRWCVVMTDDHKPAAVPGRGTAQQRCTHANASPRATAQPDFEAAQGAADAGGQGRTVCILPSLNALRMVSIWRPLLWPRRTSRSHIVQYELRPLEVVEKSFTAFSSLQRLHRLWPGLHAATMSFTRLSSVPSCARNTSLVPSGTGPPLTPVEHRESARAHACKEQGCREGRIEPLAPSERPRC